MITKNNTKTLHYLDRDTDIDALAEEILRVKKIELIEFLRIRKNRLQEKEAGNFDTIEDTTKAKDGELEKMMWFFRGAVIPYYIRQRYDFWEESIPSSLKARGTDEVKTRVGFLKYDHTGHITTEVNSMLAFDKVKDLNLFLTQIEEVCFNDDGYEFPDSENFNRLRESKGYDAAKRQAFQELYERHKNKHYKREINN